MEGAVCLACHAWLDPEIQACPGCGENIVWDGDAKNIIDCLQPNCLISRYDGCDLLEPAVVLREGKSNVKAATKLKEYSQPVTVPKHRVYAFDHTVLSSVQSLRNERTATVMRYDRLIESHWKQLRPFKPY
jgi:hypothetical protein